MVLIHLENRFYMKKRHYDARNILALFNLFRMILIPVKVYFGYNIERIEFIFQNFYLSVITFIALMTAMMIRPRCTIFVLMVELAQAVVVIVYFIILTNSQFAHEHMWGTVAFCIFDLLILLIMVIPGLTFLDSIYEVNRERRREIEDRKRVREISSNNQQQKVKLNWPSLSRF